jgi:hypothetical protein
MTNDVVEFISSLRSSLSGLFPCAEVDFDGANLSVYFRKSPASSGDHHFVHLLVDLTCMEEDNCGCVAVHARPVHIFAPFITVVGEERVLTLRECQQEPFVDGEFLDEHEDGHGNLMWSFHFPEDSCRIADLACGLTKIAAAYFSGEN